MWPAIEVDQPIDNTRVPYVLRWSDTEEDTDSDGPPPLMSSSSSSSLSSIAELPSPPPEAELQVVSADTNTKSFGNPMFDEDDMEVDDVGEVTSEIQLQTTANHRGTRVRTQPV